MHTKEEIRKAVSLSEVISKYTPITRSKALCPFHPDKNPSLSISEAKGLWHCFACGVGGDTFTFVMKAEGATFSEAVKILADRYGITQTHNNFQQSAKIKQQRNLTQSKISELKQKWEDELDALKKCDRLLGDLWKEVNGSKHPRREVRLEIIEAWFAEFDERYKQMEKWYGNQSREMCRKALLQGSGRNCVAQI